MIHSIINSNKPFTHYLLKNGIDTYHVDKTKKNALFYAIDQKYENLDIITSLISSENINFEGPDKITPLILAVKRKHNKTVELLLEKNAFVDCYVESTGFLITNFFLSKNYYIIYCRRYATSYCCTR